MNAAYACRLTGRTQIYLFILASDLIYAFSFYIVNLELSFKVLTKKIYNLVLGCKRVCFSCSLSVKSMKFGMMIVFKVNTSFHISNGHEIWKQELTSFQGPKKDRIWCHRQKVR